MSKFTLSIFLFMLQILGCQNKPVISTEPKERDPAFFKSTQDLRQEIVSFAKKQNKKPYVWDHNGPNSFDCSGFTHYVLTKTLGSRFGLAYDLKQLPGYKAQSLYYRDQLVKADAEIECSQAQNADIIFFPQTQTMPNHIGIITNAQKKIFITAQNKDYGVFEDSYSPKSYWGYRKPRCFHNIWIE